MALGNPSHMLTSTPYVRVAFSSSEPSRAPFTDRCANITLAELPRLRPFGGKRLDYTWDYEEPALLETDSKHTKKEPRPLGIPPLTRKEHPHES